MGIYGQTVLLLVLVVFAVLCEIDVRRYQRPFSQITAGLDVITPRKKSRTPRGTNSLKSGVLWRFFSPFVSIAVLLSL
jgi:hypothetical protein